MSKGVPAFASAPLILLVSSSVTSFRMASRLKIPVTPQPLVPAGMAGRKTLSGLLRSGPGFALTAHTQLLLASILHPMMDRVRHHRLLPIAQVHQEREFHSVTLQGEACHSLP